ncbi:hypothetical protein BPT24_012 [Tenacibaculum phage pT24]|uniref:Uncharacterized protein n=1 Tax=Tenacibaculum phage pT24 TaxID=1880590 RepID=A0A1B4XWH1_9CAUD|nr:hypothetical protein HYP10_gp012 [Tenacibaculum phage pT24]BAV39134.1 hypothetical protein BPT24_012 [Tenacibaculum phage pT24]
MTKLELLIRQIKRNPKSIKSISYELSDRLIELFDKVMEYSCYYEIIMNPEFMDRYVVDLDCVINICQKYLSNIDGLSDQLTSQLSYLGAMENNFIHDESERLYNEIGFLEPKELDNNYKLSFYNDDMYK